MEKINRFNCPHNSRNFTEAHDFDYHYSQKCGNGCGYSHGDLIKELEQELAKVKEENEKLKQLVGDFISDCERCDRYFQSSSTRNQFQKRLMNKKKEALGE